VSVSIGIDGRKLRGRYGPKLTEGQSFSEKYPGVISCGNGVYRKPATWINKKGRERSINYYFLEVTCTACGVTMLSHRMNALRGRSFCSKSCKKEKLQSESAGNRIVKKREHGEGHHVLIKMHDHPRAGMHGNVFEHILVAEEKVGRPILKTERVHHINLIKSDNDPRNLFVCANDTEHFKIHGSLNRCVAELMAMGVLIFDEESKTYQVKK
jgi:endogenous inhibitor of DNA gyrase (YacG/DUF329 family)